VQLCGDAHLVNFGAFASPERRLVFDAAMPILDAWYARFDIQNALARLKSDLPKKAVRQSKAQIAKARTRDSTQALVRRLRGAVGADRIRAHVCAPGQRCGDDGILGEQRHQGSHVSGFVRRGQTFDDGSFG
jgi:Uncharacterized protein conserved in bacteria (DUF2252)